MSFLDFINESLDSHFDIIKQEKGKFGVDLYYLDMDKPYRIFVEESNSILHIGFERKLKDWTISTITNDLSIKEVLGLFGTVLYIVKQRKFKGLYIETEDPKKNQLYFNMIKKLNKEFNMIQTRDEYSIMLLSDTEIDLNKKSFKYKKQ